MGMRMEGSSDAARLFRIALMLPRFSRYGGVEQFGYRLAEILAKRGHAVDFICGRQEIEPPKGVNVIAVGRPPGFRAIKMLWYIAQAERKRKQGKYDISISLGKNWNQDLIRVGGGPLYTFWHKSERAVPCGPKRFLKRVRRLFSPSSWLTLFIEQHQFSRFSEVIVVSHLVRDWLMEAHPSLNPSNVHVVYNRPDTQRFFVPAPEERRVCRDALWKITQITNVSRESSIEQPCPNDGLIFIGTATTNFQLKGIDPLIRSLVRLPSNVHFFIAGGRSDTDYKALAEELGVAERVHFCGKVDDMPSFYKALDIFVLATFYDACSNAVLEALASGCKVISTADNGASYFLPPENIVADPARVEELHTVLQAQINAPKPAPFVWPDAVESGIDSFVAHVEGMLTR